MIRRLFPKRCGLSWCPPWTGLVQWIDWHLNHPYGDCYPGHPDSHWAPRSEKVCDFFDRITNNWAHD